MTSDIPGGIYDLDLYYLDGRPGLLNDHRGKVTLVVNVASKAGYVPACSPIWSYARTVRQFAQLQAVHDMFRDRGFSVIGIPCGQFGRQEPEQDPVIKAFMSSNYPFVTFPLSQKIDVNGKNRHDLYTLLSGGSSRRTSTSPADMSEAAIEGWNQSGGDFARIPHTWEKFVVGRDGRMITRFNWQANPLDREPLMTGEHWTLIECLDEVLG